jgi:endonuclease YncB( thermonuclease family)
MIAHLIVVAAASFSCTVTRVYDGDGPLWCDNGIKIRVAGIQAPDFENTEPCRRAREYYVCNNASARRSQQIVQAITLHKTLVCEPVDRSYGRVVVRCALSDGRSLSCAILMAGAATRWNRYLRKYRMGDCR